jgi:glucosamine--fructose-6-phosphate aminotransferase (isomerizing)
MYDAIRAQPELIRRALAANAAALDEAAADLRAAGRLIVTGIGTSFHAATLGAEFLRILGAPVEARAVHAFEFAEYHADPPPGSAVIVVSHRGTKGYSLRSLEKARAAGALTIAVTSTETAEGIRAAGRLLLTCEQEASAAHTKSYTCALALLGALAARLAGDDGARAALAGVSGLLEGLLQAEAAIERLARAHAERSRWILAGGGPHAVTASEIALKLRETSYVAAEGHQVEQLLHGPLCAVDGECLVVGIAPPGPSRTRCRELLRAARTIGAFTVALCAEGDEELAHTAEAWIALPPVPEVWSPLVTVVPLQLLCYHLALARRANPDTFRLDHPRYKEAYSRVRL